MTKYRIQDLGDGEGLDVLDGKGDLLASGRTSQEVLDFLYDHEYDDDGEDQKIVVTGGAFGRAEDEEVTSSDLINEIERGDQS